MYTPRLNGSTAFQNLRAHAMWPSAPAGSVHCAMTSKSQHASRRLNAVADGSFRVHSPSTRNSRIALIGEVVAAACSMTRSISSSLELCEVAGLPVAVHAERVAAVEQRVQHRVRNRSHHVGDRRREVPDRRESRFGFFDVAEPRGDQRDDVMAVGCVDDAGVDGEIVRTVAADLGRRTSARRAPLRTATPPCRRRRSARPDAAGTRTT